MGTIFNVGVKNASLTLAVMFYHRVIIVPQSPHLLKSPEELDINLWVSGSGTNFLTNIILY